MKNKTTRFICWLIINSSLLVCATLGVHGFSRSGNVAAFFVTLFAIINTIGAFLCVDDAKLKASVISKGRSAPEGLSMFFDTCICVTFVYEGWFFCGAMAMLSMIMEAVIYMDKDKKTTD